MVSWCRRDGPGTTHDAEKRADRAEFMRATAQAIHAATMCLSKSPSTQVRYWNTNCKRDQFLQRDGLHEFSHSMDVHALTARPDSTHFGTAFWYSMDVHALQISQEKIPQQDNFKSFTLVVPPTMRMLHDSLDCLRINAVCQLAKVVQYTEGTVILV